MREYLSHKGVEFEELDVRRDPQALRDLTQTHRSNATPTVVIDGEVIIGFDPARIDALLAG